MKQRFILTSDRKHKDAVESVSNLEPEPVMEVIIQPYVEKRTVLQNAALHKGFTLLAESLNDAGYEMKSVLSVKEVDIPWTDVSIKEVLFRPIMVAMLDKHSTTELSTKEISEVWLVLTRHLGEHFGIDVPFPSNEPPMI